MSDPVDTDVLRAWNAGRADEKLFSMVAAAADEVDRLRAALKDADNRLALGVLVNLDGEQFVDHPVMQMLAERNERLRSVIENAPHAYECFADFAPGSECTCWKADVHG